MMTKITLSVLDQNSNIKICKSAFDFLMLTYKGEYQAGDVIRIEVDNPPCYLKLRLEDSLESCLVYVTEKLFEFQIPFGDQKRLYNSDKAFQGGLHFLWVRSAREYEINQYGNLAFNPYCQPQQKGVYPQISSNIVPSNIRFAPYNVIDGIFDSNAHGSYPFTSWSNAQSPNAQLKIDFGRTVEIDGLILMLRADFPHDAWWESLSVHFSDGSEEILHLSRTGQPQTFSFKQRQSDFILLTNFIKGEDKSPFTALTQIEVLGQNIRIQHSEK
ncbi:hypothetical protein ACU6T4_00295 [Avibacterium paragallinarum]|uniref:carbohydrate-binding protein n=1 Tax=Avibacterium paragallinarum TaxID=728 RepID=UPI000A7A5D00|nr:carbohydrate-binding protein [Avibacterium paragallinarum]AZI13810.1 carbohydrate-binding protein [Avibacterium paragallinarum]QIR11871.1 carbohydrate-binding protein [Avibacterium paragallinarum]QJE09756.1 carbohydrate-binding protein [Avibacterium paragallinarum]QJE11952.1 carbohydrate-binding protein [Avibacterium paragallinarum]QJE14152.1 carbohydrate-binding protein [Avibacterium paragallinarum]